MALILTVGTAYDYPTANAAGDAAGVPRLRDAFNRELSWKSIGGAVPGMTVNPGLVGTPATAGTYTLTLTGPDETDEYGDPAPGQKVNFDVTVEPAPAPEPGTEPEPGTAPLVASVLAFLGLPENLETVALATQHVRVVTTFVRNYVRGNGFTETGPNADLEDVVVSAAARYVVNPQQLTRQNLGNQAVGYASLEGFTLAEKAVLHRYRRRTA